jgi:iron(III) transport system ATP-binding protein
VILLDEPFSSLDTSLRAATRSAVTAALLAAGTTAILVTHDQAEALSLATQVGVMRDGNLATVIGGVATGPLGATTVRSVPDGPVELLVRPEQIRLEPVTDGRPIGVVTASTFSGADATVTLLLDDGTEILARTPGRFAPQPGDRVGITRDGPTPAYPATDPSTSSTPADRDDIRTTEPARTRH